jgi:competence protein ComEC
MMRWLIIFLLLLLLSWLHWHISVNRLPLNDFGRPVLVKGFIRDIPKKNRLGIRFLLQVESVAKKTQSGYLQVAWYKAIRQPHPGEKWAFYLKIKPIHGLRNPGGFHSERWARVRHILASAYVVPHYQPELLKKKHFSIDAFRYQIQQSLDARYIQGHYQVFRQQNIINSILNALSIGSKNLLSPETWLVFQRTGTSHLMAISGLHVGLVVSLSYGCFLWLARCLPFLLVFYPAQRIATVFSVLAAWWYGFLVGFSLPTQRSVVMVTALMLSLILNRKVSLWRRWLFAFIVILFFQPFSIFSPSFWLSFLAVFWMGYALLGWGEEKSRLKKWARVQMVLTLGLLPLSLYCFHQFSLVSFFANIVAIPWVTLLIVPLCLLACVVFVFSSAGAIWIWWLAGKCFLPLWYFLSWLSHWSFSIWLHPINDFFLLLLMLLAVTLLMLPAGLPLRSLGVLMLPLFFYWPDRPKSQTFWLTVLDVGQGLSAVVQTAHHVLVYDAGPRYPSGFDAGRSVLVPFLKTQGIKRINTLMVSHGDNDHIGGSFWLVNHYPVSNIMTSIPKGRWHHNFSHCFAGQKWRWDGVDFNVLWPPKEQRYQDNNSSCVLHIQAGQQSALLTGDIEKPVEQALLRQPNELLADVMVAPHHGSRSSSSMPFIAAIQPKVVIMSVGFRNRYHFPAVSTLRHYASSGAQILTTSKKGAVRVELGGNSAIIGHE